MKKLISAIAIATLSFVAFADAEFALNYRTQMSAASRVLSGKKDEALKNHTYLFSQASYGGASDTVSATVAGDMCGATIRIDPEGTSGNLTINQYNGYVNIGKWTIAAGSWKDGQYIGDYQLKSDADACNIGGESFAAYKLGNMFKGATTISFDDIANFAGGDKSSTAYIKWGGKVGKTFVQAFGSAIGINTSTWNDDASIYTGFGAKVDVKGQKMRGQVVAKSSSNKKAKPTRGIGAYFMPQGLGATEITFGGALGFEGENLTEASADFRLRYGAKNWSFTTLNNVSHITNQCTVASAVSKEVGAWADNGADKIAVVATNSGKGVVANQKFQTIMWNAFSLRSKLTKKAYFICTAGDMVYLNNMFNKEAAWSGIDAFVMPGLQVFAGGKTSITCGVRYGMSGLLAQTLDAKGDREAYSKNNETSSAILVPVVMRIRF